MQVHDEFLKDLRAHDTRAGAPQLFNERPRALVLYAGSRVVRVDQDIRIDEVLIAHAARRETAAASSVSRVPFSGGRALAAGHARTPCARAQATPADL